MSCRVKYLLVAASVLAAAASGKAQSADALIDKLVDKGILTAGEAKDLREESDQGFTEAVQTKFGMPDWGTGYKISGDVRGRFEDFTSDNKAFNIYERYRYRLRFGITVNMKDNLELGFRLGSGDPKGAAGNPLSQSSTLQGDFSSKNIYIDTAYAKWTPIRSDGWIASATIGKMDNPFQYTWMVFDPDITPEGAVVNTSWQVNDRHSLSVAGGAFVLNAGILNNQYSSQNIPFFYGGQVMWNAQWTDKFSTAIGGGGFEMGNGEQLTSANVPLINLGNTRTIVLQNQGGTAVPLYSLKYRYAPIIADASATYLLDSFPFYNGKFPIKVAGEFMQNLYVGKQNQGLWAGVTFGKSGTKGTWDISYRYEQLEADAWYDQMVDDDNGVFYPGNYPTANNAAPGYYGGSNIQGHMVKFNYSFTDSLTFTVTCYVNDLINRNGLVNSIYVPNNKNSDMIHMMADINLVF